MEVGCVHVPGGISRAGIQAKRSQLQQIPTPHKITVFNGMAQTQTSRITNHFTHWLLGDKTDFQAILETSNGLLWQRPLLASCLLPINFRMQ